MHYFVRGDVDRSLEYQYVAAEIAKIRADQPEVTDLQAREIFCRENPGLRQIAEQGDESLK